MSTELATVSPGVPMELTSKQVMNQVQLIQEVMRDAMKDGEHYGKIPGCGEKPALLKAGAEKLSLTFRLAPSYKIERLDLPNGHREYIIICELRHIETGKLLGAGVGSCSTMESKYRWRGGARKCPECGKEAIIKGKAEYGGGWLCFPKKGGCNAKWKDGDSIIEGQETGRIENPDIADQYNTVLKMSKKRSQVDATLTALAASDLFTQDIEERLEDAQQVTATVVDSKPLQQALAAQAKPAQSPNGQVPADVIAKAKKYAEECETIEALSDLKKEMVDKGWPFWSNETKAIVIARGEVLMKLEAQEAELNGNGAMERDRS